jgi:hypothetical protein
MSNSVAILLGKGDGTFGPAVSYAVQQLPIAIAVGDFNGDGKLDLAVANDGNYNHNQFYGGGVSVLLGNGDGTFQPRVSYLSDQRATGVAVADFSGDGNADLAITLASDIAVLLGNGDGTFRLTATLTVSTLKNGQPSVGDFNGDGKLDIAITGAGLVSVFTGNGDGTFNGPLGFVAEWAPIWAAVGDFNGDGKADIAVVNYHSNSVSLLTNATP